MKLSNITILSNCSIVPLTQRLQVAWCGCRYATSVSSFCLCGLHLKTIWLARWFPAAVCCSLQTVLEHLVDSCVRVDPKSKVTPVLVPELCLDRPAAISAGSRLFMTNCEVSPRTVGGLQLLQPRHHRSLHSFSPEAFLLLRPCGTCALTDPEHRVALLRWTAGKCGQSVSHRC